MNIFSKLTFLIFSWTLVRVEAWDSTDSWRSRTSASNQIFSPPSFPFPPLFSLPLPHFSSSYILFLFPKLPAPPLLSLAPFFLLVSPTAHTSVIFPAIWKGVHCWNRLLKIKSLCVGTKKMVVYYLDFISAVSIIYYWAYLLIPMQ